MSSPLLTTCNSRSKSESGNEENTTRQGWIEFAGSADRGKVCRHNKSTIAVGRKGREQVVTVQDMKGLGIGRYPRCVAIVVYTTSVRVDMCTLHYARHFDEMGLTPPDPQWSQLWSSDGSYVQASLREVRFKSHVHSYSLYVRVLRSTLLHWSTMGV